MGEYKSHKQDFLQGQNGSSQSPSASAKDTTDVHSHSFTTNDNRENEGNSWESSSSSSSSANSLMLKSVNKSESSTPHVPSPTENLKQQNSPILKSPPLPESQADLFQECVTPVISIRDPSPSRKHTTKTKTVETAEPKLPSQSELAEHQISRRKSQPPIAAPSLWDSLKIMLCDMEHFIGGPFKYLIVAILYLIWAPPTFVMGLLFGVAGTLVVAGGAVVFLIHYYNNGNHHPGVGPDGDPFNKAGVEDPMVLWGGNESYGCHNEDGKDGGESVKTERSILSSKDSIKGLRSHEKSSERNRDEDVGNLREGAGGGFFQSVTKGFLYVATEWDGRRKHNGVMFFGTLRTNLLLLSKKEDRSHAVDTTILLEGCSVKLLPENGEESIRFNHRYPICIEHPSRVLWGESYKRIYCFIRPSREKEIWYRSLVTAQQFLDKTLLEEKNALLSEYFDYMFKLQRKSEQINDYGLTWFNIFVGRVYWDMKTNRKIVTAIATKIQKAMDRINRPSYMGRINLRDLDIGHSLPLITNIDSVASDDRGIRAVVHVDYSGSFFGTMETRVQLEKKPEKDKPSPFNFRKWMNKIVNHVNDTPITLSVKLRSLKGKMQLHIAQPETDRLWYGFYGMPEMEMEVKAVIGQKFIKMTKITEFLEKQLRKEFASVYVLPNMDDTRIVAMSDSEGFHRREMVKEVIRTLRPSMDTQPTTPVPTPIDPETPEPLSPLSLGQRKELLPESPGSSCTSYVPVEGRQNRTSFASSGRSDSSTSFEFHDAFADMTYSDLDPASDFS